MGYNEGMDEMMRFLVEKKGHSATDPLCADLLQQLKKHRDKLCPSKSQLLYQRLIFESNVLFIVDVYPFGLNHACSHPF